VKPDELRLIPETVSVPAGQFVLRRGDPGDSLYAVLDGESEVARRQGSKDVLLYSASASSKGSCMMTS
jgi:CRP-like cAMP-binding protein